MDPFPSFTSRSPETDRALVVTPAGSPFMKKRTVSVSVSATTATCCHVSFTTRLVDVGASAHASPASPGTLSTFQNINVPGACVCFGPQHPAPPEPSSQINISDQPLLPSIARTCARCNSIGLIHAWKVKPVRAGSSEST